MSEPAFKPCPHCAREVASVTLEGQQYRLSPCNHWVPGYVEGADGSHIMWMVEIIDG